MRYIIGLDNGGTEIKCALYNEQGKELAAASRHARISAPAAGFAERDAQEVWELNCQAVREVMAKSGAASENVCGIGVTGYGNGLVFLDRERKPVYPCIVSTDTRAVGYVRRWMDEGIADKIFAWTRQELFASQAPPLIAWFRDNKPEILEAAMYAVQIKDYIRTCLTGEVAAEYTDLSNTALLNVDCRKYAEEVFGLTGITRYRRLFTDNLIRSHEHAGMLTEAASKELGLPSGIEVCGGLFDIDACCLASGSLSEEVLCIVGGTWVINEYICEDIEQGRGKMATTLSFLKDKFLISDSSATGAANFNWYLRKFMRGSHSELSDKELYARCNEIVAGISPADSQAIFVPYIFSSATGINSKGAFLNINELDDADTLLRAVYEGIVFSSSLHVKRLEKNRKPFARARLSGGIAKSSIWCQMFADVLCIPVEVVDIDNPGAFGAAICAGICCGIWKDYQNAVGDVVKIRKVYYPDSDKTEIYKQKQKRYQKAVEAVDWMSGEL